MVENGWRIFPEFVGLLLLFVWYYSSNKSSGKLYRKRGSWNPDAFWNGNCSMEEREEEKKLLVPRIRFGSFELLNIDAETLFSTFLCRETRDEFLRIFFFFFPLLRLIESSTSLFDTMLSTKLFITLSFITLLPFPFSWNVNRSKCKPFRTKEEAREGTEIKERYLENFPFVNVSTDCRKTFSNFTLEETTNDASFSHVGLPPCRLLLLHLISIGRADSSTRFTRRNNERRKHRSYYSYHYRKNS